MEELNIREIYHFFKGKIIWILITIVAIVIIGNTYTKLTRVPMYQSTTTLILANKSKEEEEYNFQFNKSLVNTYSQIVKSRTVISKVINNLKLKCSADDLANKIIVSPIQDSEVLQISVSSKSKKDVAKITDEVAKVFSEEIKNRFQLENISVLDPAEVAVSPYNINYLKDNLIYIMIGLILSCGVIFIMFYFDTSIKSSEIIEDKLNLTVLGIVPIENKE